MTGTTEGTFYKGELQVPGYALHLYSYAELLHNKKIREKKGKKGIALRDIASKVHLLARLAMANWLHEIDRRGYKECFKSIT
jgi:hypothetical protein